MNEMTQDHVVYGTAGGRSFRAWEEETWVNVRPSELAGHRPGGSRAALFVYWMPKAVIQGEHTVTIVLLSDWAG